MSEQMTKPKLDPHEREALQGRVEQLEAHLDNLYDRPIPRAKRVRLSLLVSAKLGAALRTLAEYEA